MFEVTQSLLSSWLYMFNAYDTDAAEQEFIRSLNREPKEPSDAMWCGLEFERAVYLEASGASREPDLMWEPGIHKVAKHLVGAQVQLKLKRSTEIDGIPVTCVGVLDALKAGVIYDVKFSTRSLGSIDAVGKYMESPQHPMYFFLCPEAYEFQYLLSDGQDLYIEKYRPEETDPIDGVIYEFFQYLKFTDLMEVYKDKWKLK